MQSFSLPAPPSWRVARGGAASPTELRQHL